MARPRSDIDVRIVHAARKRFLHDGVDGASLRDIARAARTSIGMIYYYFPSKDDLFLAVVEEVYGKLLADLTVALSSERPVEERLRALFARLAALDEAEFVVVRLVMREVMVSSTRRARIVDRFFRGHVPLILTTVLEGLAQGVLDGRHPAPVLGIATFALALMPQLLIRLVTEQLPPGFELPRPDELGERMADVLLRGIAAR